MVKKALLIGINYKGTGQELKGCINDIENLNRRLVTKFKYFQSNITVLTDNTPEKPTKANIEKALRNLVYNCKAGDTLLFQYSGHGSNISDKTSDETDGRDEVLVPIDYTTAGVLTDDWMFTNLCAKIPMGVKLVCITDCCHSGTIMDLRINVRSNCKQKQVTQNGKYVPEDWTDDFSFSLERTRDTPGQVILFSGCQDKETSADAFINGSGQGAFTSCLLEFLDSNPNCKLRNVLKELNARLDLKGFTGQNSQLSIGRINDLDTIFSL